jgi:hypothetical protein
MSTTGPAGPENSDSPSLGDEIRKMAATYSGRLSPTAAELESLAAQADRLEHQADVGRRWAAQAALLEAQRPTREQVQALVDRCFDANEENPSVCHDEMIVDGMMRLIEGRS